MKKLSRLSHKLLPLLLCGVLLLTALPVFSACSPDTAPVITINDVGFTAGQYLFYQLDAYNTIANKMSSTFNPTDSDGNAVKLSLKQQMAFTTNIDGSPVDIWIKNTTVASLRQVVAYDELMEQYGLTLDEDDIIDTNSNADYLYEYYQEHYNDYYTRNGISADTVRFWMLSSLKRQTIFRYLYDVGGSKGVSAEEIQACFEQNYAYTKIISLPYYNTETGESLTEDELADVETYVQSIVTRINNGEDIDALNRELLAAETDYDVSQISALESQIFLLSESSYTGNFVSTFQSLDYGTAGYDKDENYGFFFIFYKMDPMAEGLDYFQTYYFNALSILKEDEFTEDVTALAQDYPIEINDRLVKKYDPVHISRISD